MDWTLPRTTLVFFTIIFGGDVITLPIVLAGPSVPLDYGILAALVAVATVCTDSFWYTVGKMVPHDRLSALPHIRRRRVFIEDMLQRFDAHPVRYIFLSKFVFGTRASLLVVAGTRRAAFLPILGAALVGALAWFVVLCGVFALVELGLTQLQFRDAHLVVGLGAIVFIALTILLHRLLSRFVRTRYWSRTE